MYPILFDHIILYNKTSVSELCVYENHNILLRSNRMTFFLATCLIGTKYIIIYNVQ